MYKCKQCRYRFVWVSDLPNRRFFSKAISFAVEIYSTIGISLRVLSKTLKKFFDIKVSYEGIRQWVLQDKTSHFVDDKVDNARTWHCDETWVKVKGKWQMLWVVYCKETRQVLAWHLSPIIVLKHAMTVLQKAKQRVNGRRPEKIVTDGLWQYNVAIYKVMGWNWKEHKIRYVKDSGIGKNAAIERVNREIKRRYNWFSTFQSQQGAESFFKLFFSYYNRRTAHARANTG